MSRRRQQNAAELTSDKQGAMCKLTFNAQGDNVTWYDSTKMIMSSTAWLPPDPVLPPTQRVTNSYRGKVIIFDLKKDVCFSLTQHWN